MFWEYSLLSIFSFSMSYFESIFHLLASFLGSQIGNSLLVRKNVLAHPSLLTHLQNTISLLLAPLKMPAPCVVSVKCCLIVGQK